MDIPRGPFEVKTGNSTYRFGPTCDDGFRDVTRNGSPLSFTRCTVTLLEEGKPMHLSRGGGKSWNTTSVKAVIKRATPPQPQLPH